ncbi:hypothetical protein OAV76_03110 [Schleiferiaceae bacterium]|nr:hypothetical protein [Schleiferiaceae bacterium]
MNVESIVYDLFQELTRLRERIYELEKYKKLIEGELHHIEFDIKKLKRSNLYDDDDDLPF